MMKTKIYPHKMYFSPKTAKLCLQLEYFVLKSIRPRDVA